MASTPSLIWATYAGLAILYLLVLPLLSLLYVDKRWTSAGAWEKVLMFFLVLFFFPGMVLVAPFMTFRPKPRSL
ncbi:NAD(P)H-quinone oxidoreductase subunit L [Synechococcus sp. H55.7]|uniref:NAD(P)H-quinone oxidoreductase subunit L n=1 Tax=unclassified Synechococcus TaxID=2626047 RepID=UPI0039C353D2